MLLSLGLLPGGGRGRGRRRLVQKYLPPLSPLDSSTDNFQLSAYPPSDEEVPPARSAAAPFPPITAKIHPFTPSDAEMVIKSEPVDDVDNVQASAAQCNYTLQLGDHSYSCTDHVDLPADDQSQSAPVIEEPPLSRTSGLKCGGGEESFGIFGDDANSHTTVVVRIRKKRAPSITNRLIIPVVRVARSALTDHNAIESAVRETEFTRNNFSRHTFSTG